MRKLLVVILCCVLTTNLGANTPVNNSYAAALKAYRVEKWLAKTQGVAVFGITPDTKFYLNGSRVKIMPKTSDKLTIIKLVTTVSENIAEIWFESAE